MPGNYSKLVTVITGQTITAAERNNEFDNVINNMTPDGVDDASANIAAMQATVDPAGASLATSLSGELQRIRFQLLKLGAAGGNWYDALPFLAAITPATPGATGTDLANRLAQLANQIKALGGLTNWYDSVTAALLKAGGTMAGNIAMGANKVTGLGAGASSGDALRYEQVIGLYLLLTGGTMSGAIAMGTNKITGLGNGTVATDAAAFGQLITYTPPTVFTPTIAGAGTISDAFGYYMRIGGMLWAWGHFKTGTTDATAGSIVMPTGAVNSAVLSGYGDNYLGMAINSIGAGSAAPYVATLGEAVFYDGGDTAKLYFASTAAATGSHGFNKAGGNALWVNTSFVSFNFAVPIA